MKRLLVALACFFCLTSIVTAQEEWPEAVRDALERAGDNRAELEQALRSVEGEERRGMAFLIEHMPPRDLQRLEAEFLLEHVRVAYRVFAQAPWKDDVPEHVFLDYVLPYANVSERREAWRSDFAKRFAPLVEGIENPGLAAARLNQKIFPLLGVKYSTKRKRADQGPYESIETGLASCTGLSILLIDACRAVGIPARFVGTPRWSDDSGNHSWVEIWSDGRWHFTGAAEPNGDELDKGWFTGRASEARRDEPRYAIYAVSYRKTPLRFPMVWSRRADPVHAVNVTDRYTGQEPPVPEGSALVRFRARMGGERREVALRIENAAGEVVFEGRTKDEGFDANDHVGAVLRLGERYVVEFAYETRRLRREIEVTRDQQLVSVDLDRPAQSIDPLAAYQAFLATEREQRAPIAEQAFATIPLTREQAARVRELAIADHEAHIRTTRAAEMKARVLKIGDLEMPFFYAPFGEEPLNGRSLYLSMHGGGNARAAVNDRQWENQKKLYAIEEGIYLAPRAPTNTWNLWHQAHIDAFFGRLIENLIVFENVDPNRVYLLGYSAGGDGVYQLAPRMADRFAAAAMMAGHPNETSPLGLRNLPFTLHMGGKDQAYRRNEVARAWKTRLAELAAEDEGGYPHWVEIHEDHGHWMQKDDAAALPWMAKFTRRTNPDRIVWKQDDVRHDRFYWLATDAAQAKDRALVVAEREGQSIRIETADVERLQIRLNDTMLDLDQEVTVTRGDETLFRGQVPRTIATIATTLAERGDPAAVYSAQIEVRIPKADRAP